MAELLFTYTVPDEDTCCGCIFFAPVDTNSIQVQKASKRRCSLFHCDIYEEKKCSQCKNQITGRDSSEKLYVVCKQSDDKTLSNNRCIDGKIYHSKERAQKVADTRNEVENVTFYYVEEVESIDMWK